MIIGVLLGPGKREVEVHRARYGHETSRVMDCIAGPPDGHVVADLHPVIRHPGSYFGGVRYIQDVARFAVFKNIQRRGARCGIGLDDLLKHL
jgi:hypothetical protein